MKEGPEDLTENAVNSVASAKSMTAKEEKGNLSAGGANLEVNARVSAVKERASAAKEEKEDPTANARILTVKKESAANSAATGNHSVEKEGKENLLARNGNSAENAKKDVLATEVNDSENAVKEVSENPVTETASSVGTEKKDSAGKENLMIKKISEEKEKIEKVMRKISLLGIMALLALCTMAQEKKTFTLEDLIPGGKNYYNCSPKNLYGIQWWGDRFIRPDVEEIKSVDPLTGNEESIAKIEDINEILEKADAGKLFHFYEVSFPYAGKPLMRITTTKKNLLLDFVHKEIEWSQDVNQEDENAEWEKNSRCRSFTRGNNLFVTLADGKTVQITDEPAGVKCGQSVHRDEFGITKGTFWSPKGNLLAFYRMDERMVTDYPQVNTSTRIATLEADKYPMAGMTSHKVSIGIFNPATQKTVWLKTADPTDRYFTNISWSPDEKEIYVIELNRDQNHAQLIRYNAITGDKEKVLLEETHPKYVEPQHPLTFLPWDDSKFIYQSQKDGYNHLYLYNTEGKLLKQLTKGNWIVQDLTGFAPKNKEVIILSTEISPLQSNTYAVSTITGKRRPIGNSIGVHQIALSNSGNYLIDRFSAPDIPRIIDILGTKDNATRHIMKADDPWKEYKVPEISVGTIKAADGKTDLYYRLVKPVDFDANKKYPAVIYVYGGPHAQNISATNHYAVRGWDIYMATKGYVMLTVDNRGSSNRGLEFENATFRHLGVEEVKDQMEGEKMLESLPYVDKNRIGIHGWSFGGFMTINLMLTHPEVFKTGVAGGPVIDWKYYEVMYGERYMDTPETNPEGYKGSCLNERAGNLKGHLDIIIGGNDKTVVPQHTFSFLRACIDAGTHPDLFIYPGGAHNMVGRDRVHLHEHITRYFEDYLK